VSRNRSGGRKASWSVWVENCAEGWRQSYTAEYISLCSFAAFSSRLFRFFPGSRSCV